MKNTSKSLDLGVRFCALSCIIIDEITFMHDVCYHDVCYNERVLKEKEAN